MFGENIAEENMMEVLAMLQAEEDGTEWNPQEPKPKRSGSFWTLHDDESLEEQEELRTLLQECED